jgi:trimethylamine--corrinoid protein Co-methyltransferase
MIYGSGMIESGITFDYGQLVMDCEIARMIKHAVQGFEVDDDSLALDVIKEIGPGGHFLMHEHTFDRMRDQSRTMFWRRFAPSSSKPKKKWE